MAGRRESSLQQPLVTRTSQHHNGKYQTASLVNENRIAPGSDTIQAMNTWQHKSVANSRSGWANTGCNSPDQEGSPQAYNTNKPSAFAQHWKLFSGIITTKPSCDMSQHMSTVQKGIRNTPRRSKSQWVIDRALYQDSKTRQITLSTISTHKSLNGDLWVWAVIFFFIVFVFVLTATQVSFFPTYTSSHHSSSVH